MLIILQIGLAAMLCYNFYKLGYKSGKKDEKNFQEFKKDFNKQKTNNK